jgi:hypothetical protein
VTNMQSQDWNVLSLLITLILLSGFLFFFFCETGVWTQGFTLTKQVLYCSVLEAHLQYILLWLFWRWGTVCLGWPWTLIVLVLSSQVARIIGMSHWHPAPFLFLMWHFIWLHRYFWPNWGTVFLGLFWVYVSLVMLYFLSVYKCGFFCVFYIL